MGTLFGFAVGYVLGARAGGRGFDDVIRAVREIRESREFQGFVDALRDHARHTARELSARLAGPTWPAS